MLVFAFDPGTSSVGWAALRVPGSAEEHAELKLVGMGTNLFSSRPGSPPFRPRSLPEMHRTRRRKRKRRKGLLRLLQWHELIPIDEDAIKVLFSSDPYQLRARGLSEPLSRFEFGRAIWHIARRRGVAKYPCRNVESRPPGDFPTWGAWLWSRRSGSHQPVRPVRNRLHAVIDAEVNLAPPRDALKHEFDLLWTKQQSYDPALSDELRHKVRQAVFGRLRSPHPSTNATPSNRVRSPAVTSAFAQTMKLMRAMSRTFGQPDLIAIESFGAARSTGWVSLNGRGDKARMPRTARRRLQLLRRQQRAAGGHAFCPYTGSRIVDVMALSSEVEIDHIIPSSRSGGKTSGNLTLCLASANRIKSCRTPREAFGLDGRWIDILRRARNLPVENRHYLLARRGELDHRVSEPEDCHTHAMRQIVNLLHKFARKSYPTTRLVLIDPTSATRLRKSHCLSSSIDLDDSGTQKDRRDHRHHAIDAFYIAIAAASVNLDRARTAELVRQAIQKIPGLIPSTRIRSQKNGLLHRETIYGNSSETRGNFTIHRKPITGLSAREIKLVRDCKLRQTLEELTAGGKAGERRKLLARYAAETGVRRVRLLRRMNDAISLPDRKTGALSRLVRPYEIDHLDIVRDREGIWQIFGATSHDVRQKAWRPVWEKANCGLLLVMRLRKANMLTLDSANDDRIIRRVVRLVPSSGHIYLADPNAAGRLSSRHRNSGDLFRWEILNAEALRRRNARLVQVNRLGHIIA